MRLTHAALNGNRTTRETRDPQLDEVVEQLRPVVSDGAGAVPLFDGWFLDVRMLRAAEESGSPGGAYLQLSEQPPPSPEPAVMAVACWTEADSVACWAQADAVYRSLQGPLRACGLWQAPPRRPPAIPWIATWFTPYAATIDPAVLQALGAVERAVAWVLIEDAGRF